jgi:hypothetical protein
MKRIAVVVMLAAGAVLASCGGSSPPATTTTTSSTTTSTTSAGAQDLTATSGIKTALLAAGAASHQLPVTDYTGLTTGLTYYAYDPGDATYWAGAQLVPSSSSQPAQVGAQDDGAYDLFSMTAGGTWTAYNDGFGTVAGSTCSIVVPAAVRTVWGWSLTAPCGGPPSSAGAQDLTVTAAIKSALLAAGAASHQLPVSDYTGLTKGLTFYAYDPGDALYWAGAQLVPSSSSQPAQIGAQDDGSYDLFTMTAGGSWTAYDDGLGTIPGSSCSIVVPAAVRTAWGWSLTTPCGGPPGS